MGRGKTSAPRVSRRFFAGTIAFAAAAVAATMVLRLGPARSGQAKITLDPTSRFQTFRAWETTAVFDWPIPEIRHKDKVYDHLLQTIGISRLRVEVYAGDENSRNTFAELRAGKLNNDLLRLYRYQTVNDNDDPLHINQAGFHFDELDWRVDTVWLPLKKRADELGLPLEFSLNYVAFTNQAKGGPYIHDQPEEYAEFMLAAFQHLQEKYWLVPDSLELVLEPDLIAQWNPSIFARATLAVTKRLTQAGFKPRLVLPSTTSAAQAPIWFEAVAATPGAMELVKELSFHLYRGATREALIEIGKRGQTYGIETGMLEYWLGKGTHDQLFRCLKLANISSWQSRAYLGYGNPDKSRPPGEVIGEPEDVRMSLPYFHSIERGAVRIGANSSDQALFDAVAFINTGDRWSVLIEARGAGRVTVSGLPEGRYYVTTSTASGNVTLPDRIALRAGRDVIATIDSPGVIAVSAMPPKRLVR